MGGHRVAQPVQHIDLVPTILDLVGMSVPPDLHGRSLRPVLERKELRASLIYSESLYGRYHFGWSELMALTEDRYRFIHAPREELYDLATDRTERHNVAAARPQTTAAMRAALASIAQTARVNRPAATDTEQLKRLAALGYVTTQVDLPPEASGAALPDPKDKIAVLQNYRRVVDFAQEGRLAAAIDLLRSILKDEPTMADLWLQLAMLQRRVGNTSQSIEAYQRVLRLRPHNTSAALALASAFLALGRFDEAAAAAQTALTDASHESRDLAAGHELLARIALARDDAATARREAAAAVSADGSLPLPQFVEGRLAYSAGDFPRAIAAFDGALRRSTTLTRQVAELHLFAGDTLAHLGRFDDAEHQFEEEIRFFPANIWAYASLANLYHAEGRTAECTRALDAMLRAVPSPEAFSLATRLLTEFGEAERAAQTRAAARRQFAGSQSR
jgi:tetratricopeptide (TPR) repeat protein